MSRAQDLADYERYGAPVHRDEQPDGTAPVCLSAGSDYRDGRWTSGWSDDSRVNWSQVSSDIEYGDKDSPIGVPTSGYWFETNGLDGELGTAETSRPFIRPRLSVFLNKALLGMGRLAGKTDGESSNGPARRNEPPQRAFPAGWGAVSRWPRARSRYRVLGESK